MQNDKLVENDESEHPLLKAIEPLTPNLVTGESKNDFDENASNIGTTFYTGISLEKEISTFYITCKTMKKL